MRRTKILEENEIIPLTFDYVFTSIFNNPKNIDIVESFISSYLDIPNEEIKGKVTLNSRFLELENKKSKNKQVDLILDLNGEKINIELSNKINRGIIDRNIVYAANIHGRQLKYGESNYNKINKTLQINLNNMNTNKKLKETYYLTNEEGRILTDKFQIDMIDMVIGKNMCYTQNEEKLAKWCRVFTSTKNSELKSSLEGLMEKETKDKLIDEVVKYSEDEETVALYSAYSREELERNTFIDDARKEGIEEGINQIAKNMLEEGIDVKLIEKVTNLSKEKINDLKNS